MIISDTVTVTQIPSNVPIDLVDLVNRSIIECADVVHMPASQKAIVASLTAYKAHRFVIEGDTNQFGYTIHLSSNADDQQDLIAFVIDSFIGKWGIIQALLQASLQSALTTKLESSETFYENWCDAMDCERPRPS